MKTRIFALVGALALILAACGGSAATAENGELVIDLTEFEFNPSSIELVVGQEVTFVLSNQGEKEHEFMVGRTVNTAPGYPNGFEEDFFETAEALVEPMDAMEGMEGMDMGGEGEMEGGDDGEMSEGEMGEAEHTGLMIVREPGQQATITFTPTADSVGEWQIGCFEEDGAHWDDGMSGTLTVVEG